MTLVELTSTLKKIVLHSSVTRMTPVELKYLTIRIYPELLWFNKLDNYLSDGKTRSLFIRRTGICIISHNNC